MKQTENRDKDGREWYFGIEAKTIPNGQKIYGVWTMAGDKKIFFNDAFPTRYRAVKFCKSQLACSDWKVKNLKQAGGKK